MHSLFSRARTTSQSRAKELASDEFGRVAAELPPPLPKKDKKDKDKKDKDKRRQRTTSIPKDTRPSFLRSPSPEPERESGTFGAPSAD
jgi:hypothetical protein